MVAFRGLHNSEFTPGAIFTSNGGPVSTFAVAGVGSFGPLGDVTINDAGTIAFDASDGIFTGPDLVADKVIGPGDPLFGSTVLSLDFDRGLNDNGDVAVRYLLTNGVSGIALAVITEPEAATALLAAAAGLLSRSRRRHRAGR